jgi:hypothetical protein
MKSNKQALMYGVIVLEQDQTIIAKRFFSLMAARAASARLLLRFPAAIVQLREGRPPGEFANSPGLLTVS